MALILALFLILLPQTPPAPTPSEDPEMARLFAAAGVEGTLVIASADGRQSYVHNGRRAARRYPAASTFKILNSLIALEEGVISGAEDRLQWDGTRHNFESWNRDQTLRSAFQVSCVWCYQELARRIGPARYRHHLRQAGYGELREPFELTRFWLDGSLRVSALDQIELLRRITRRSLPYRPQSYDTLRQVMLVESGPEVAYPYELRAKTGWATISSPEIGWYVGYAESRGRVWLFALNIDLRSEADLPLRLKLAWAALDSKLKSEK